MKRRMNNILSMMILSMMIFATILFAGCGNTKRDTENVDTSTQTTEGSYRNEMQENGTAYDDRGEIVDAKEDIVQDDSYETDSGGSADVLSIQVAPQNEKLIYTYHYSVETKQFDAFYQDAIQKAEQLGGYVQESETNGSSVSNENRYARIVLRIPSDKKNQMLSMVQKEANVTYSNVTTDNVTLNYVDMQSHIQALRKEQSTLLTLIEKAQKINDLIALQSQLTQVRYEIESYESKLRTMDNLITYSTINLQISEVQRTTAVTGSKTSLGDEIKNKFFDNLYAVGQWLEELLVWLVSSLPILIPLAAAIILACILLRKRLRHITGRLHDKKNSSNALWRNTADQDEDAQQDMTDQDEDAQQNISDQDEDT